MTRADSDPGTFRRAHSTKFCWVYRLGDRSGRSTYPGGAPFAEMLDQAVASAGNCGYRDPFIDSWKSALASGVLNT
eukprot:scaffold11536_cov107-Isochrysis_galbana.AAC.2